MAYRYSSSSSGSHSYAMTASAHSYGYSGFIGARSIDRSKPMSFKAFESDRFYPPFYSRYDDAPPIKAISEVIEAVKSGKITAQQFGDLSQWVFEVAGDFLAQGVMNQKSMFRLRDLMMDAVAIVAGCSDTIYRKMSRDGGILPLKIVSGWWKDDHVNSEDGWITQSPVATEDRVLTKDTKWMTSRQYKGAIFDIGLAGALYVAYSMRVDNEKHHNIFAVPLYMTVEYLNNVDFDEYERLLLRILRLMAEHEKAISTKPTEPDEQPKPKPGYVPIETKTAKYEIGMFG